MRLFAALLLSLLVVLSVGGLGSGRAFARAPERASSARVTQYDAGPQNRRLRLAVEIGGCTRRIRLVSLVESGRAVRLRIQRIDVGEVCTAVVLSRCVTVTLSRRLGTRSIIDASRGRRVRRTSDLRTDGRPCQRLAPARRG